MEPFEIVGPITGREVIAQGEGIRTLKQLRAKYGGKHWKKVKGFADVKLWDGSIARAEVHWYEANGIGRKDQKIKRLLD